MVQFHSLRGNDMAKKTKDIYKKQRKPYVFIVCEGRNKTEITYFDHFKERSAPFNLHCIKCESTDILSMAKKANSLFLDKSLDLDLNLGDRVFCLVDLDLDQKKHEVYITAKNRYKRINIIPSNPCFEVWLQYYFKKFPKVVCSSQKVKEEMAKILLGYTESMDVIAEANIDLSNHVQAIQNSELRNSYYSDDQSLIERNPYTEVATVVALLINYRKD